MLKALNSMELDMGGTDINKSHKLESHLMFHF